MIFLFDTLNLYLNPGVSYHFSDSGTANTSGFRQASFGITFDPDRFTFFSENTSPSSGTGTTRTVYYRRSEGPNLLHAVNRSGTTYTGDIRVRARQISIDPGITAMGIYDTWLAPLYQDFTNRLWGCYSASGQTGNIEFYLDIGLSGLSDYKTATIRCSLL